MKQQYEKGQAIVLIAAIMIGLIAMLGLAIDGGGLFFLKRDLQNATDAAIVAATYAKCSGSSTAQIEAAARSAAEKNGFVEDDDRHTEIVVLQGPPPNVNVTNPDDYVRVSITADKEKFFIQLVYAGEMNVSAKAVGKCNRLYNSNAARAIFAGGSCGGGCSLSISGSGTHIEGGTHSNGCTEVPNDADTPPPHTVVDSNSPRPIEPAPNPPEVAPIPMPIVYRVTEFDDPNDPFVIAAKAAELVDGKLHYFKFTKNIDLPGDVTNQQLQDGALIYTTGNINIKGGGSPSALTASAYKFTLVAGGEISQSATLSGKTFVSYLNVLMGDPQFSLFMFSAKETSGCAASAAAIKFSPSSVTVYGMLYAPYAGIQMNFSSSTLYGALWARTVDYAGSQSTIIFDPNTVPVSRTTISIPSD